MFTSYFACANNSSYEKEDGGFVRTILGIAVCVLVWSSPAVCQPACEDDAVLKQVFAKHFGFSEFRGMTDDQIRDEIIVAPGTQRWREMASESEVGKAISDWVINIDVQAISSAQHLVRSVASEAGSYEPKSKTYTCEVSFDFDKGKLVSYVTLAILNSWLQLDNGIRVLELAASMNQAVKWADIEQSLNYRLRGLAERTASCVRRRVTFTVELKGSDFAVDLDSAPAYDQDCLRRHSSK